MIKQNKKKQTNKTKYKSDVYITGLCINKTSTGNIPMISIQNFSIRFEKNFKLLTLKCQ